MIPCAEEVSEESSEVQICLEPSLASHPYFVPLRARRGVGGVGTRYLDEGPKCSQSEVYRVPTGLHTYPSCVLTPFDHTSALSGPLNRLNAILSLLHPLDRYRTPSAIGSAIGRPLSCLVSHPSTGGRGGVSAQPPPRGLPPGNGSQLFFV